TLAQRAGDSAHGDYYRIADAAGPGAESDLRSCGIITNFDSACVYFWNEPQEKTELRLRRGHINDGPQVPWGGNLLHFWVTQQAQPLLMETGRNPKVDAELAATGAKSALIVPLFVKSR